MKQNFNQMVLSSQALGGYAKRLVSYLLFAGSLLVFSCQKSTEVRTGPESLSKQDDPGNNGWQSPNQVLAWNLAIQQAYTFPIGAGAPPPVLSRLFALYHIAMHDALNSIKPKYATYAYHGRDKDADPDMAVAQAVHDVLKAAGPQGAGFQPFTDLLNGTLTQVPDGDAKTRGIALGKAVAEAVLQRRAPDMPYLALFYSTIPANGTMPGAYRYIAPLNTCAIAGFHLQQTWVIPSASFFRPGPPDDVNSDAYAQDYNEVKAYGAINSTVRSAEQTEIGVFWAENSSRGWNAVVRDIIEQRPGNSMDAWKTARLLALMHLAIADGYISVFDAKIFYYYWRPISAIQLGDTDGNPNTVGDPNWKPVLGTPAVGEYSSAHALTGAAAGRVIERFFGTSQLSFTTTSGYLPGTRSYTNLRDAIRDNSLSRIYIGYHFRKAVEVGEASGFEIGDYIFERGLKER